MAKDGVMPEISDKVLTVLEHKTKTWSDVDHSWQFQASDFLNWFSGRLLLNPEYPNLAIIYADCEVEYLQIEDWFSFVDTGLKNVSVHLFPDAKSGIPDERIFSQVAKIIQESGLKK